MYRFALLVIFVTLLTSSIAQAASYKKTDGTIVDPILHIYGSTHDYSGNNLEPEANLSEAYLRYANLTNANLSLADLSLADLYAANLTGADDVETIYDHSNPCYYGNTVLPVGFDPVVQGWTLAPDCNFTPHAACELADINQMFDAGNLVTGVAAVGSTDGYDLSDNDTIDASDITEWLSQAAIANGYGSPMLRGDTDGFGNIFPAPRTVDITDFQNFLTGFTGSCLNWKCGNFNGDNEVDITTHVFDD